MPDPKRRGRPPGPPKEKSHKPMGRPPVKVWDVRLGRSIKQAERLPSFFYELIRDIRFKDELEKLMLDFWASK